MTPFKTDNMIQQECCVAVFTGKAVVKEPTTCQHGGGNFAHKPVERDADVFVVTHKCAGCGVIRRFRRDGGGPWTEV